MNNVTDKYFEYGDVKIFFVYEHKKYWIAIKPVCTILGIDYCRQFRNVKKDPVINGTIKLRYFNAADNKNRVMTCLPEFIFYYWLLQIRSSKKEIRPSQFELFTTIYKQLNYSIRLKSLIYRRQKNLFNS